MSLGDLAHDADVMVEAIETEDGLLATLVEVVLEEEEGQPDGHEVEEADGGGHEDEGGGDDGRGDEEDHDEEHDEVEEDGH